MVNIDSLTAVVQQNPSDPNAYNVRGTAYGKPGRYSERSPISTRRSTSIRTSTRPMPTGHWSSASSAMRTRRSNDYNTAIQINPSYATAYVGRGNMYRAHKQYNLALADFDHAIQHRPERSARLP